MGGRAVKISKRGEVPPFYVMRVLDAAAARRAAGKVVYDLSAGQPSTGAPKPVVDAVAAALGKQTLGYTGALGVPELRDAIAHHYLRTYSLDVTRDDVVATTGSSGGLQLAFLAAFDAGDTVVVTRPGYPAYRNMLHALGCTVVDLPLGENFRLDVAQLDALDVIPDGLVLASPANPTGAMLSADALADVVRWCDRHGVRLISDEIYHGITFGDPGSCAWSTSRSPIVLASFSKYFSMTGWRLGWLLVPEELRDAVDRITGNFTICPPAISQHAGVAAFEAYDELDANVARYATNRELLLRRLPEIGIDRLAPADGAFYVYADVARWTDDALGWAARLLDETGVAVAPGVDFDPVDGNKFIRLCFAGDTGQIGDAVGVLGQWLARQPVR
jgi:aspartate/methionine/tyrosine aminotransferase